MTEIGDKASEYFSAYYYSFDATGVPEIDSILKAIARAGKAYHHTEDWNDIPYSSSGDDTPVQWIQKAADAAAISLKSSPAAGATPSITDTQVEAVRTALIKAAESIDLKTDHGGASIDTIYGYSEGATDMQSEIVAALQAAKVTG